MLRDCHMVFPRVCRRSSRCNWASDKGLAQVAHHVQICLDCVQMNFTCICTCMQVLLARCILCMLLSCLPYG